MTTLTDTYTLNNGVKIPKVGFGTWQIPDGKTAYDAVSFALEAGYRHIDTAYVYGNEKSVGRAIRDFGLPRDQVFVTSKLPAEVKDAKNVRSYAEETLSNLGLDHLDLYLIHAPWPWGQAGQRHWDEENAAVWAEMVRANKDGLSRAVGVSNFDKHDLESLIKSTDLVPAVNQIKYYVGFTEPIIRTYAESQGILIEAYSPLATGGILNNVDIEEIAEHYGVSVPQLAIRFCIQNGVLPLPKATSQAHVEANTNLDFTISAEDMATLNALPDPDPARHNKTQG